MAPALSLEAARIHLASNRVAEAVQVLEHLARVEPSNPRLHLLLARAMRRRNDLPRAARHIEIASRLASDLPGLTFEAALVGLARGHAADARGLLVKELDARGAPTDRVDLLEIVQALLTTGLAARAMTVFSARFGNAIRHTNGSDIELMRVGARLSLEQGDLTEGRARSRRLLALDPRSMIAMHNLALIALQRGRFALARGWIARGRATDPSDSGMRKLRLLWWWRRLLAPLSRD